MMVRLSSVLEAGDDTVAGLRMTQHGGRKHVTEKPTSCTESKGAFSSTIDTYI